MPKKSVKKASKPVIQPQVVGKVNQLAVQAWVGIAIVVLFLIVLFYQMMTQSFPQDNPNFLTPDQQVKPVPIENQTSIQNY